MRHHEDRAAGRQRHGRRWIRRREERLPRIGLAQHREVGVAGVHGQMRLDIAFLGPPLRRKRGALHGLGEGGLGRRQVCLGGLFEDGKEIAHRHGPVEHRRRLERLLDMHADEMGAVALRQRHGDGKPVGNLWIGVAMHQNCPVAHGRLLPG
jgi:hypothetical protein